jgi:hypothetical protein
VVPTVGFIVVGRRGGGGRKPTKLEGTLLYREEQTFGWPWPGIPFVIASVATALAVLVPFGLGMWQQLVLGKPWGSRPMPNGALALIGPFAVLMSLLPLAVVLFARLEVEVRTDGIRIDLRRLRCPQVLRGGEMQSASLAHIGPFGGWGASRHGRKLVYRMEGAEGVLLELANGRKVFIGSQRPRALHEAIRALREHEPRR